MTLSFAGGLAALTAAFIWAISTMIYARTGGRMPAMLLNLIKGSVAVGFLVLTVLILGDAPPELETRHWLWLAGSGLVGISIGDSAYFASIRRIGPAQTLLVESIAPPLTGLALLLDPAGSGGQDQELLLTGAGLTARIRARFTSAAWD